MSTTNSNIRLITMSSYNRPEITEVKSKGYVKNGKKPTEYYDYIIDRYKGSPTNAAVINSMVSLIYGNGLAPFSSNYNVSHWVFLNQVLKPRDLKAIITDYVIFGEGSLQVVGSKGGGLSSMNHIAKNKVLPSIANEDEVIDSFWFSKDWSNLNANPAEEIEAFKHDEKQPLSIYNIKPYSVGNEYFRDPTYKAGLVYAELEEEISNFYINHIKNGLSFGYVINVPDSGTLTEVDKDNIERDIKKKLAGSQNAGKFIINFAPMNAQGQIVEITVTPLEINDAHNQWEYLTKEARQQILTAHRVTSPMLFGVKDATGLGNNANELIEAKKLMLNDVIKPERQPIIEAIEDILLKFDIGLKLKFLDTEQEQSNISLSEKKKDSFEVYGEDIDLEEWELIDQIDVNYEEEKYLFDKIEMASTGTARPNAKSSQDGENFIVRYKYTGNKTPEREFCKKMMQANKVYRKEDILMMGNNSVNPGWGAKGADNYDIWLYKGGGNCHHKWQRQIYLKKGSSVDVNSPLAEIISTSEARRKGFKIETNDTLVSIEPRNMDNNGFLEPR